MVLVDKARKVRVNASEDDGHAQGGWNSLQMIHPVIILCLFFLSCMRPVAGIRLANAV